VTKSTGDNRFGGGFLAVPIMLHSGRLGIVFISELP